MDKKKVLIIAPISKDKGGNYTTGVCKVAESLMKQRYPDATLYLSSTNISYNKAKILCQYEYQYNGYRYLFFDILKAIILNPVSLYREFQFYKNKCHVNPLRFFFYRINIERQINEIHPDIIHVHTTECPSVLFANKNNIPAIVTMHGVFYRGKPEQSKLGDFLKNCINRFKLFTGLTKECKSLMIKYMNLNDDQIKIIPNGIDSSKYYFDINERIKLRNEYNIRDSIVFITVASVQPRKGQLVFLKLLKDLNIDWKYWILGTGPDVEKIKEYCESNGLKDRVYLFGHVESEALYKYYSAADVYAHVSTMEGQALCEMEAYSTGLKIIVNQDIKDTIATDVTNEEIYCILNFNDINRDELIHWVLQNNTQRLSRCGTDWQEVANMYDKLYKSIEHN